MQQIKVVDFGETPCGKASLFHLSNGKIEVAITNYGCTIVSVFTADSFGKKENIVSGFNSVEDYLQDDRYMGCIVGRYANRIAQGKFSLNNTDYQLSVNNATNHLHGGWKGFNRKLATVKSFTEEDNATGVTFSFSSPHGEEGYPGNLEVQISYVLDTQNELSICYEAQTDKTTILNLTNHSYFNLSGFMQDTIHNHYLQIDADKYIDKTPQNVPSGEIVDIKSSPLDFKIPKKLKEGIDSFGDEMGYDHDFVLNNYGDGISEAANLLDPVSGRLLKVYTDSPGLHIYSANWWDEGCNGQHGKPYFKHGAIALETQFFPDSPNKSHFPTTVLNPGEIFRSKTVFKFLNIYKSND